MRTAPTGLSVGTVGNWTGNNAVNSPSTVTSISFNNAGVNSAAIVVGFTSTAGTPTRMASGASGYVGFTGAEL